MALLPTFRSACDLANRLPSQIASFMDLEIAVSRRFREDSLSDLFLASFLQIQGVAVVIRTPIEHHTGSDFDLSLVDPGTNTAIQYRIQAKRLGKTTTKWQTRSYKELAHPQDTGKQVEILCDLANLVGPPPTIPLYAFYNPASVCVEAGVPGIAFADAFEIEQVVSNALTARPRPLFKRITSVRPLFFELSEILCPPGPTSGRLVATPQESRDAYERVTAARPRSIYGVLKKSPLPGVGEIPPDLYEALSVSDRERIQRAKIDRPQIVLSSSHPIDMQD